MAKVIDGFLGPEYDRMMVLLKTLRKDLQERVSTQPKRAEFLAKVLDSDEVWAALRDGDTGKAMEISRSIQSEYIDL